MNFEMNIEKGSNQYFQTDKGNILEVYHDKNFPNPAAAGLTGAKRISGRFLSEASKMAELNMRPMRPDLSDPKTVPTTLDELRELTGVNGAKLNINLETIQGRINDHIDAHADEFSPGAKHTRSLCDMLEFSEKYGIQTDDIMLCRIEEEGRDIAMYIYDDIAFRAETGMELKDAPAELKKAVLDEAVQMYQAYKEGQVFSCNLYNSKGKHIAEHRGFFGNNIEENGMLSCIPDAIVNDMGQMPSIGIAKFRAMREAEPQLKSLSELIGMASGEKTENTAAPKQKDDISL